MTAAGLLQQEQTLLYEGVEIVGGLFRQQAQSEVGWVHVLSRVNRLNLNLSFCVMAAGLLQQNQTLLLECKS